MQCSYFVSEDGNSRTYATYFPSLICHFQIQIWTNKSALEYLEILSLFNVPLLYQKPLGGN